MSLEDRYHKFHFFLLGNNCNKANNVSPVRLLPDDVLYTIWVNYILINFKVPQIIYLGLYDIYVQNFKVEECHLVYFSKCFSPDWTTLPSELICGNRYWAMDYIQHKERCNKYFNRDLLKYIISKLDVIRRDYLRFVISLLVEHGDLDMLKWIQNEFRKWPNVMFTTYLQKVDLFTDMINACVYGHLDILEWLYGEFKDCYLAAKADHVYGCNLLDAACTFGHIRTLDWLKRHLSEESPSSDMGFLNAAMFGHLEILKYIRVHYPHVICTPDVFDYAVGHGHLDTVIWLRSFYPKVKCTKNAFFLAARRGSTETLEWFLINYEHYFNNATIMKRVVEIAAIHNEITFLKKLDDMRSIAWYAKKMITAAVFESNDKAINVVEFAKSRFHNDSLFTTDFCDHVCGNGNIRLLKWFQLHFPRIQGTVRGLQGAIKKGLPDNAKFMFEHYASVQNISAKKKAIAWTKRSFWVTMNRVLWTWLDELEF